MSMWKIVVQVRTAKFFDALMLARLLQGVTQFFAFADLSAYSSCAPRTPLHSRSKVRTAYVERYVKL